MWAFANIATEERLEYRDALIKLGVLEEVARQLGRPVKRALYVRTAVWLISNLLKGTPFPPFRQVDNNYTQSENE